MFFSMLLIAAATAAAAPVPVPNAFATYRQACLETQADPSTVRALAASRSWSPLTPAEKDQIAPGNPDAVEGWGLGQGAERMRVSITHTTLKGGVEQGNQTSCTLSSNQGNDDAFIKAYSQHLKRNPGDNSNDGGTHTVVWSVFASGGRAMHYYFSGADGAGLTSTLSVTVLKKSE